MSDEYLLLKWGTLKGWNAGGNESAQAALRRYHDEPTCMSAMAQRDTENQKQAIYDLIDAINGPITNEWTGENMTKEAARKYVAEHGN